MAYKFQVSLEVLNHLGRGLYRNFATVVAEAISNSWDAGATKVEIEINKSDGEMTIKDNGTGMNKNDFQNKFLKIGYARRDDTAIKESERAVLGRKGIGKLALLSIAKQVTINTKKKRGKETGGIINNAALNDAIKKNLTVGKYSLGDIKAEDKIFGEGEHGTCITFQGIKEVMNNPEMIKKYLAIIFNFSISSPNENFDMYIKGKRGMEKIDKSCLKELYENTQYIWSLGQLEKEVPDYLLETGFMQWQGKGKNRKRVKGERKEKVLGQKIFGVKKEHTIRGYIASVAQPSNLAIKGSGGEFRAKLNLFVNGRLRHEDIFEDVPTGQASQYPKSYIYGEIHVDSFDMKDAKDDDIFTSNRESIIKDDPRYRQFLKELTAINKQVIDLWGKWRGEKNKAEFTPKSFKNMNDDKKKFFKGLQNIDPTKDTSEVLDIVKEKVEEIIPKESKKKILICHSSKDKKFANKVEQRLLDKKIPPEIILYSSSKNPKSRIRTGMHVDNLYGYIKRFFIENWHKKPIVIYVGSKNLENSWGACLEVGASWVIAGVKQILTMAPRYNRQDPLPQSLYIRFKTNGDFVNEQDAEETFQDIADYVFANFDLSEILKNP